MKKRTLSLCLFTLFPFLLWGQGRLSDALMAEIVKTAGVTPEMESRAAAFRRSIRTDDGYRSGAYVYKGRSMTDYKDDPAKLAARLALLGFTDAYLGGRPSDPTTGAWIRTFIETATRFGMEVQALFLSSTKLFVSDEIIFKDVKELDDYNQSVKKSQRYAGISADLEPHMMKAGRSIRPPGLVWEWDSQKNNGVGKDNDLLLKRTVEVMKTAKAELGNRWLSQATHPSFERHVSEGNAAHGGAAEFLKYCDQLIIMAYNERMESVWNTSEPTIAAGAAKPRSVGIAVKTTMNHDSASTSLQPGGWDNLLTAMHYLMERGKTYPAFRGVDVFEFQGFEMMWNGTAPTK